MMAKWYQKLIMALPPKTWCMMCARPTASVGAPPVRETTECSPTSLAVWVRVPGSRWTPVRPSEFTNCTAPSTVPWVAPTGEFIAK